MKRRRTILVLAAAPVQAETLSSILHGSYAPGGECGGDTAAIVGPEGVELLAAGETTLIRDWTVCTDCNANAVQPGLLAIAHGGADEPTLRFEAQDSQVVLTVEEASGAIAAALAEASPLPRCIDAP